MLSTNSYQVSWVSSCQTITLLTVEMWRCSISLPPHCSIFFLPSPSPLLLFLPFLFIILLFLIIHLLFLFLLFPPFLFIMPLPSLSHFPPPLFHASSPPVSPFSPHLSLFPLPPGLPPFLLFLPSLLLFLPFLFFNLFFPLQTLPFFLLALIIPLPPPPSPPLPPLLPISGCLGMADIALSSWDCHQQLSSSGGPSDQTPGEIEHGHIRLAPRHRHNIATVANAQPDQRRSPYG